MLKYLLDTNACIRFLSGRSDTLRDRLRSTPRDEIGICTVVMAELYAGAGKSINPEGALSKQRSFLSAFTTLMFDEPAAEAYGRIRSHLERHGSPIGPYDLQIAAIALANDLTLVTHNTREFTRVPGLSIEDWEV